MEALYGIMVVTLLSLFFLNSKRKKWEIDEQKMIELNSKIELKQLQLLELEKKIKDQTIDKSVALTKIQIEVLNIYDNSGIKVPVEIIEDLHSLRLDNEKEILEFIENQRYFWKLENTKKPFKR